MVILAGLYACGPWHVHPPVFALVRLHHFAHRVLEVIV